MILTYTETGSANAPAVVLLGSIASTTKMWKPQVSALADNYRVIAIEHRGHAGVAAPEVEPGKTRISDLADDVLETLDHIGVNSFAVVGLSLGGSLAQYLAATSDRVTRAVFACTAAYFGGEDKWVPRAKMTREQGIGPMVEGVLDVWFTSDFRVEHPEIVDGARKMVQVTSGEGYAQCSDALAQWDFTDSLADITCPVLTIAGEQDVSTPPPALEAIAQGVSGQARSVVIAGAHVPTLQSPDAFNQALGEFLSARV